MNRRDCLKNLAILAPALVFGSTQAQCEENANSLRLRVVSYNIQIGRGPGGSYSDPREAFLSRTAERISSLTPDVAGLQEVDNKTDRSGSEVDQLGELARLTKLNGTFAPKTELPGGWYGIGVLSREKPEKTSRVIMKGSSHPRALQICEYSQFVFFNTHLPLTEELRKQSVEAIEAEAQKYSKPIVLVGDFNAEPKSPEILALKERWTQISPDKPTFPSTGPTAEIDYIFVRNVKDAVVHETYVVDDPKTSDHCPVFCDATLSW